MSRLPSAGGGRGRGRALIAEPAAPRPAASARAAVSSQPAVPARSAPPAAPADPDAVIREARARQRRRRQRAAAAVVTASAVIGGGVFLVVGRPGSAPGPRPGPSRPAGPVPSVDAAAFAGHGRLAFVSRGTLWVLDGATRTLRRLPTPGAAPLDPAFSRDGRWLAFLAASADPAGTTSYTLWLAAGNGSGAHKVRGVTAAGFLGWSPGRDVLAVTAAPRPARVPGGIADAVWIVSPSGPARRLTRVAGIESAAWAPGGGSIAVAAASYTASTLATYSLAGGTPKLWLSLTTRGGSGVMNYIIDPAGWWPHQGIGFWANSDSASLAADQDPFYVIAAPGARPRLLGDTLSGATPGQVATAPDGRLAIVGEVAGAGGGRVIWQGRRVETCGAATAGCAAVPSPPSTVTLDPAWSPDGTMLALVRAPSLRSAGFPQHVVRAWYRAHQLWLYDPASRSLRSLDANGASAPTWSADGTSLLYAARDGIWLLPRLGGRPARIADPLFRPGRWPSYYGQVGWSTQFAWWSGGGSRARGSRAPARWHGQPG